jgi:hypothetical protein
VESAETHGALLELPILTEMVPFWKMSSSKRLGLERQNLAMGTRRRRLQRVRDLARVWHPLKFDFCRMTMHELTKMVDRVIQDDAQTPTSMKPIVAIGHTKELVDMKTIEHFLSYLSSKGIAISTFEEIYPKCN